MKATFSFTETELTAESTCNAVAPYEFDDPGRGRRRSISETDPRFSMAISLFVPPSLSRSAWLGVTRGRWRVIYNGRINVFHFAATLSPTTITHSPCRRAADSVPTRRPHSSSV